MSKEAIMAPLHKIRALMAIVEASAPSPQGHAIEKPMQQQFYELKHCIVRSHLLHMEMLAAIELGEMSR